MHRKVVFWFLLSLAAFYFWYVFRIPVFAAQAYGPFLPTGQEATVIIQGPQASPLSADAYGPYLPKKIIVTLKDQTLRYYNGNQEVGHFLISSGLPLTPSPVGEFAVQKKYYLVDYKGTNSDGTTYDFPKTKWNLLFLWHEGGNYYIHGAYWHHNFGHPMSHGCINVSYQNMEPLFNWADVGTPVIIQD